MTAETSFHDSADSPGSDDDGRKVLAADEREQSRSSHHTRSNSVSFEADNVNDDEHTASRQQRVLARHSPTHHSVRPQSHSHSRASSSAAITGAQSGGPSAKRVNSSSMNGLNIASGSSQQQLLGVGSPSGGRKRRTSSRRVPSSGKRDVRTIDYGLGLLDDPAFLDPSTRAQIAELESRVDDIHASSLPSTQADALAPPLAPPLSHPRSPRTPPRSFSHTSQPSPLHSPSHNNNHGRDSAPDTDAPSLLTSVPQVEFPRRASSPYAPSGQNHNNQRAQLSPSPHPQDSGHDPPQRSTSQRRRFNTMLHDVKGRLGGKSSPAKEKDHYRHPRAVSGSATGGLLEPGPGTVMYEIRAENRIQAYREKLSPGALERAQTAKQQLETRYALLFDSLAKHDSSPPVHLLNVIRWRRDVADARRRDFKHLAMTELSVSPRPLSRQGQSPAAPTSSTSTPMAQSLSLSSRSRSNPTPNNHNSNLSPDRIIDYDAESASLHWLPYLSSLHARFLHPTGRRDMKDWHVTAQVVKDYVLHSHLAVVQPAQGSLVAGPRADAVRVNPGYHPRSSAELARGTRVASPSNTTGTTSVRASSLEMHRPDPIAELERLQLERSTSPSASASVSASNDQHHPDLATTSGHPEENSGGVGKGKQGTTSPRSSLHHFRISLQGLTGLTALRAQQQQQRPTSPSTRTMASFHSGGTGTRSGPNSPPLHAVEGGFQFSPSSSVHRFNDGGQHRRTASTATREREREQRRRGASTMAFAALSDDPGSSELEMDLSLSEGVTDPDADEPFGQRLARASRARAQSQNQNQTRFAGARVGTRGGTLSASDDNNDSPAPGAQSGAASRAVSLSASPSAAPSANAARTAMQRSTSASTSNSHTTSRWPARGALPMLPLFSRRNTGKTVEALSQGAPGPALGASAGDPTSPISGNETEDSHSGLGVGGGRKMAAETHAYTADFLSQFPRADHTSSTKGQIDGVRSRSGSQMNALGEKGGGGSWDESLGRQREYYAHREAILHQIRVQNAKLDRAAVDARAQITEFLRVRKLLISEMGLASSSSSSSSSSSFDPNLDPNVGHELIEAFEPLKADALAELAPGPHGRGYKRAEALNAHRIRSLRLARRFILAACSSSGISWLRPESVITADRERETAVMIEKARTDVARLDTDWARVRGKIERLRGVQDTVTDLMGRLNQLFEQTAIQIDTAYPQLVRNVDLARQLSVTGQTSLPYISTLPPWAREVLGPFIEYTLELIGILIRWLLYPIWRLLPNWLRVIVAFIGVLLGSIIVFAVTLLYKYWTLSVAFGRYLSTFRIVRSGVLFTLFLLRATVDVFKTHWRVISTSGSLILFWYLTTPEDLEYG